MQFSTAIEKKELTRFSRQIILEEIGKDNHIKLSKTIPLVVGLGGLGSPVVTYLATSGIKKIILVDHDKVELHNLQRQTIHKEKYINQHKTISAQNFLKELNSDLEIKCYSDKLSKENVNEVAEEANLIIDCTDDLETRYVISDYAKKKEVTVIMASVLRFSGQVYVFPKGKSCYSCVFPDFKVSLVNCSNAGVLGSVCGIIGSLQATGAIKNVLFDYEPYILIYEAMDNSFKKVKIRKCYSECKKVILPEENQNDILIPKECFINWDDFIKEKEKYVLIDIRDKKSFDLCHLDDSINIHLTNDKSKDILFNELKKRNLSNKIPVLLCRKGISTQKIWKLINNKSVLVMEGGLTAFKNGIDHSFLIF